MKPGVFIQVRLKSQRLPLKAFRPLNGKPLLLRLIERLQPIADCGIPLIICTSYLEGDLPLISFAEHHNITYFAGHPDNLSSRFISCAKAFDIDTIIRVTGDNPFTDPSLIIDLLSQMDSKTEYIYPSNIPKGIKSEVIRPHILERMPKHDQEHNFSRWLENNAISKKYDHYFDKPVSHYSFTCDTPEDYALLCELYNRDIIPNMFVLVDIMEKMFASGTAH